MTIYTLQFHSFKSWTAKVPTPPDAPMTKTFFGFRFEAPSWAVKDSALQAVNPA